MYRERDVCVIQCVGKFENSKPALLKLLKLFNSCTIHVYLYIYSIFDTLVLTRTDTNKIICALFLLATGRCKILFHGQFLSRASSLQQQHQKL